MRMKLLIIPLMMMASIAILAAHPSAKRSNLPDNDPVIDRARGNMTKAHAKKNVPQVKKIAASHKMPTTHKAVSINKAHHTTSKLIADLMPIAADKPPAAHATATQKPQKASYSNKALKAPPLKPVKKASHKKITS